MSDRPRGRRWLKVSRAVIIRDHGICHVCHLPGADTADHIVSIKYGGAWYDMANLKAAHRGCNARRGAVPAMTTNPSRSW